MSEAPALPSKAVLHAITTDEEDPEQRPASPEMQDLSRTSQQVRASTPVNPRQRPWLPRSPWSNPSTTREECRPGLTRASLILFCFLGLIGLTIGAFVVALDRINQSNANPRPSDDPTGPHIEQGSAGKASTSTLAFLNGLFVVALLILSFGLWRSIVRITRIFLYPARQNTSLSPAEMEGNSTGREPSRTVRFLFGAPPPEHQQKEIRLPSYDTALRQAARQGARRRAAELGVSAGRRGREQYGTGDPEDLEVERILKLGGSPPQYRSDEMRKSKLVLRGAKPERRLSILSLFSNTSGSASPVSPSNRIVSAFRRWSNRSNGTAEPASPATLRRLSIDGKEAIELKETVARDGSVHSLPGRKVAKKGSTGKQGVDEKEAIAEEEEDLASMEAVMFVQNQNRLGEAVV